MKNQISHISVLQSSKVLTALYFIMVFIYTFIGIPMIVFGSHQMKVVGMFYLFGPVFMAVLGFLCVLIFGALYNVLAKWLGGVEIDITPVQ